MKDLLIGKGVPAVVAVAGVLAVALWLRGSPVVDVTKRLPGTDIASLTPSERDVVGTFQPELVLGQGVAAEWPGAWPNFRGPESDGISHEQAPLANAWAQNGPKVLWSIEVGEGHGGAAVRAGRVYLLDYDRSRQGDVLRCLSLADGEEIWRYTYPVKVKRNHGMSRTVPAVSDKYVVSLGPKCHVTCLDAISGEFRWEIDLVKEFGTRVPPWYAGQCPLIDQGRAILAPGGSVLMMAVDCETGEIVWQTHHPRRWRMTHSSIMPMALKGRRMYVYCADGGVVGVSADDGSLLWETDAWKIPIANIPTPVVIGEGRLFLSGGYNKGSMILQLEEAGGRLRARPAARFEPETFGSEQQTPVFYEGYVYGVLPRSIGGLKEQLVCMDLEGRHVWTSGPAHRFGHGPYLIADGKILAMDDEGMLTLVEASPAGFKLLAQARVLPGHDSWGPMAIAGGRLILRDLTRMVCLDLRAE